MNIKNLLNQYNFFNRFNLSDITKNNKIEIKKQISEIKTNRIIVVIPDLFIDFTGLEKQSINIINYLSYFFEIIIFHSGKKKQNDLIYSNIKFKSFSSQMNLLNALNIRNEILKLNPDCLLLMCSWNISLLWVYSLIGTGIPFIYSEHSEPELVRSRYSNPTDRDIICLLADGVRLSSIIYNENLNSNTHVIPNHIIFHNNLSVLSNTNVYIGRLIDKIKNISSIINFFNKNNKYMLNIYGKGKDKEYLESITKFSNIKFCGYEPSEIKLFANGNYLFFASYMEGFPNVVLESLSWGLPVIGLRHCKILSELINRSNGYLLDSFDNITSLKNNFNRENIKSDIYIKYSSENILLLWKNLILSVVDKKGKSNILKYE